MAFIQLERIELLVAGERIEGDLKTDLTIHDISAEMDEVAHQHSWWGGVLAAAKAEAEQLDATYRQWRAKQSLLILEKDPRLAEWKVKLQLESKPDFMRHKNAKALAVRNIEQLQNVVESFKMKADQLRSKGANMRFYLEREGMVTRSTPKKSGTRRSAASSKADEAEHDTEDESSAAGETPKAASTTEREARTERVRAKIKKRNTK